MGMRVGMPGAIVVLAAWGCDAPPVPGLYLGPPGTSETHAVVQVESGVVDTAVWRLRSVAEVEGTTSQALLPERAPTRPITFPTTYNVLAPGREGTLRVTVEALAEDGDVVGRGRGEVALVPLQGVRLRVDLGHACAVDGDCDDGLFCTGVERCHEGVCRAGPVACPAASVPCVQVSCDEEADRCVTEPDHGACRVGGAVFRYCDAQWGCSDGAPGPPHVAGPVEVAPGLARLGTLVTVSFVVTEPLAGDPVVELEAGGIARVLTPWEGGTDRAALRYAFTYVVDGLEPEGKRDLVVSLVDRTDHASRVTAAGVLELDFTGPVVVAVQGLEVTPARDGVERSALVTFLEPVAGVPEARMVGTGGGTVPWEVTAGGEGLSCRVHLQVGSAVPEGSHDVQVRATDEAGNQGGWAPVGRVVVDRTPPAVLGEARVVPSHVAVGRTVVVEVTLEEELASPARLVARDGARSLEFTAVPAPGQTLSFLRVAGVGEDGVYDLWLDEMVDQAGNLGAATRVGQVVLDGVAPSLDQVACAPSVLGAGATFRLSFHLGEPAGAAPVAWLGRTELQPVEATEGYAREGVAAPGVEDGDLPVVVLIKDRAGNSAVVTACTVRVDTVPPGVASAGLSLTAVRLGQSTYLSITATEPLPDPPVLRWTPQDPGFRHVTRAGATHLYSLHVTAVTPPGRYVLEEAALRDAADNQERVALSLGVEVDNTPPALAVSADRPRYGRAPGHNVVRVNVVLDPEDPPATVEASLSGQPATCEETGGSRLACHWTLTGDEQEGVAEVLVVAADPLGNRGAARTAVELDFTPPALVSSLVFPARARAGDVVTVHVTAGEPLGPSARMVARGPREVSLEVEASAPGTGRLAVSGQDPEGTYGVDVVLEDDVGNASAPLPAGTLVVDRSPPVLAGVHVEETHLSRVPGHDELVVHLEVPEDVAAEGGSVSVAVPGGQATCAPWKEGPPQVTCRWRVTEDAPEGTQSVLAQVRDGAGHVVERSAVVVLDFTAPGVRDVVVSPEAVRPGAVVGVSLAPLEPLRGNPVVVTEGGPGVVVEPVPDTRHAYRVQVPAGALEGPYRVLVSMEDLAGNQGVGQELGTFTVDGTPPVIVSVTLNAERFSARDGHRVVEASVLLDGEPDGRPVAVTASLGPVSLACTTPGEDAWAHRCAVTLDGSQPQGLLPVVVTATDRAGNTARETRKVTVDFTPPGVAEGSVVLVLDPALPSPRPVVGRLGEGGTATVLFRTTETLAGTPGVRASQGESGPWLVSVDDLGVVRARWVVGPGHDEGAVNLVADMVDLAGNVTTGLVVPVPLPGLVVDRTAPEVVLDVGIPSAVRTASVGTWFHSTEEEDFDCALDQAEPWSCASPLLMSDLVEGPHELRVWAVDGAGNRGAPLSLSWAVDLTPPALEVAAGPAGRVLGRDAAFQLACSEEGCAFRCRLDNRAWEPCGQSVTWPSLEPGSHVARFVALDAAGNASAEVSREWYVLHNWVAVAAGSSSTCARAEDGSAWCWGDNAKGQLGDGTWRNSAVPVRVQGNRPWSSLETGITYACGIQEDGTLWCWGYNLVGNLGDNSTDDKGVPVQVAGGGTWKDVSGGEFHTCGIRTGGQLACWGLNHFGQLGLGAASMAAYPVPVQVGLEEDWEDVTVGGQHSCGVRGNGTLWCWGDGSYSQLSGTLSGATSPVRVGTGSSWVAVAAGSLHTCALQQNGSLWCWGHNGSRQCGTDTWVVTDPTNVSPGVAWGTVAAGMESTCAQRGDDGTWWCWGANLNGQLATGGPGVSETPALVGPGTAWRHVSVGWYHGCGVAPDGSLRCWGYAGRGTHGDGTMGMHLEPAPVSLPPGAAGLDVGRGRSHAVQADGSLWSWGFNGHVGLGTFGLSVDTPALHDMGGWVTAGGGTFHACGIRSVPSPGSLWCWGRADKTGLNSSEGYVVPPRRVGTASWTLVDPGHNHTCGIRANGSLWCWGLGTSGELGLGGTTETLVPVRVGTALDWTLVTTGVMVTCGLRAGGTLWCWGSEIGKGLGVSSTTPTQVMEGHAAPWTAVSCSGVFGCALDDAHTLWCWGNNTFGQLGDGTVTDRALPVPVSSQTPWSAVATGYYHACALDLDQRLWCWGQNDFGQLGDGTTQLRAQPVAVRPDKRWLKVAPALEHTCALDVEGVVWCWGDNGWGEIGVGGMTGWVGQEVERP